MKDHPLLMKNDPKASKISSGLLLVAEQFSNGADVKSSDMMTITDDKITIEAFAYTPDEAKILLQSLQGMGLEDGVVYQRIVNGKLPMANINQVVDIPQLRKISYVTPPQHKMVGQVTSQGDVSMGTDQLRSTYGINGSGTKIGVISDTYDANGFANQLIASGDLPGPGNPLGFTTPVDVLLDAAAGIDEGQGMLEIIHDVAPGAELAYHTALGGQAVFAQGIEDLYYQANCDVVVDDIIYFAEPMFQNGIIAQAANKIVGDGGCFFSAAGNNGNDSYMSDFNAGPTVIVQDLFFGVEFPYVAHDFGGGDIFQKITFPAGPGDFTLVLNWDNPFASVSGAPGATTDLDVLLFDENLNGFFNLGVDIGGFNLNFGGDAYEILSFGVTGPFTVNLMIGAFANDNGEFVLPGKIKYVLFDGAGNIVDFSDEINKSTNYGHSNAELATAVGAARYTNTPAFGVTPPTLEGFSSLGGTPLLFSEIGVRYANPIISLKPEMTAPQGANTVFFPNPAIFGFLQDLEGDGFPNFFGTSAAAPHAAALAALLKQINPQAPSRSIVEVMKQSAIDMDNPFGPSNIQGQFDFGTGFGLVDAPAAARIVEQLGRADNTPAVPTMSEWGTFFFGFMVLLMALVSLVNLQGRMQLANNQQADYSKGFHLTRGLFIPFDKAAYFQILKQVMLLVPVAFLLILLVWGGFTAADFVGVPLTAFALSYLIYLVKIFK